MRLRVCHPQAPTKLHLTLMEPDSEDYAESVSGRLLAAGLARLAEPKGPQVRGWAGLLGGLLHCTLAMPAFFTALPAQGTAFLTRCCLNSAPACPHLPAHLTCPPPPACLQSPETAEVLEELRGCETEARRKHRGMWMYGDPGSGDEDERDDGGFPSLGGKPAGGRGAGRR